MLAIKQTSSGSDKCTVNILPCRIQYDGPTKVTKRFWSASTNDGIKTSYFRGRKLKGKVVSIPEGYQGLVLKSTDKSINIPSIQRPIPRYDEEDDESEDELRESAAEPVKIMEELSRFDEMIIWGHDSTPTSDDTFVKGIEEWMSFANAIHGSTATKAKPTNGDTK